MNKNKHPSFVPRELMRTNEKDSGVAYYLHYYAVKETNNTRIRKNTWSSRGWYIRIRFVYRYLYFFVCKIYQLALTDSYSRYYVYDYEQWYMYISLPRTRLHLKRHRRSPVVLSLTIVYIFPYMEVINIEDQVI